MPSVTNSKKIVSTAQLGDGVVQTDDLASNAVTDAKIASHTSTKITGRLIESGLAASRSATPAAGQIYFATDTKVLSVASATNTWQDFPAAILVSGGTQGDVIYFNGTTWVVLAAGTSGHFLKTNGAAANPEWAAAGASYATASDTQQLAADTERTSTDTSYALIKSIQCFYAGIVRVKYSTKGTGSPDTDTLIYMSGVSTGIGERNSTNNYVAYSHDMRVRAGDKVELWVKRTGGTSCQVKEFRLCFTKNAMSIDGQTVTD